VNCSSRPIKYMSQRTVRSGQNVGPKALVTLTSVYKLCILLSGWTIRVWVCVVRHHGIVRSLCRIV